MISGIFEQKISDEDMVLEFTLQAVPHNCSLIEASQHEPIIGEYLELFGFADVSFQDLKFRASDEVFVFYISEVKAIREERLGIEDRRLNLGRRWDMLLYTLSEERRTRNAASPYSWQNRAIHGGDVLGASVCTTRGVPIRMLPADETEKVAAELRALDIEGLRSHFVPKKMTEAGVYGMNVNALDVTPDALKRDLENLVDFYSAAAENQEGVLTFCT